MWLIKYYSFWENLKPKSSGELIPVLTEACIIIQPCPSHLFGTHTVVVFTTARSNRNIISHTGQQILECKSQRIVNSIRQSILSLPTQWIHCRCHEAYDWFSDELAFESHHVDGGIRGISNLVNWKSQFILTDHL